MPFVTRPVNEVEVEKVPRLPGISIPFSRTRKDFTTHVLVRPPMTVGVCFKVKRKTRKGKWAKRPSEVTHYKIKVPWQAFMVRMNRAGAITDTFMWFMDEKPMDVKARVYMPPLPNIYPSGHICNGTIRVNFEDPPYLKVYKAFEAFWTTPFTEETYPESSDLVPECWNREPKHYHIEYGYLKYVFEYWQDHDQNHSAKRWIDSFGDCSFPWGIFKVLNKSHPSFGSLVKTLDDAINYTLTFVPMVSHD